MRPWHAFEGGAGCACFSLLTREKHRKSPHACSILLRKGIYFEMLPRKSSWAARAK